MIIKLRYPDVIDGVWYEKGVIVASSRSYGHTVLKTDTVLTKEAGAKRAKIKQYRATNTRKTRDSGTDSRQQSPTSFRGTRVRHR